MIMNNGIKLLGILQISFLKTYLFLFPSNGGESS